MAQDLVMDDFREAKTRLKAYTDANGYETPVYETVSKRCEDVRKVYKVRVIIEGLVNTTGEGFSRRLAEYRAAINAMNEILEVRAEQKKSQNEEQSTQNQINGTGSSDQDTHDLVANDSTGVIEESEPKLNGDHNSDNQSVNDVNHNNNSIIISADINTSAEEGTGDNQVLTNGHNGDDQSQSSSSSEGGAQNDNNKVNGDNSPQKGQNNEKTSQIVTTNGRVEFMNGTTTPPKFDGIQKNSVQKLHDFCLVKQCPYPFYDTTYRDGTFLIKCRVEFNENDEKREFFGTGTGLTSKEAKLVAADDIVQQLTALTLI